jgi:hypothetical protein
VIKPEDVGTDEDLAREVLIVARDIAPCLHSFADDSEEQKDLLAVLKRVYRDLAARGSMFVKGQGIGSARIEYTAITSAFDGQPRRALLAICGGTSATGGSQGSFPTERALAKLWPESYS